jgi:VWFA-related protein
MARAFICSLIAAGLFTPTVAVAQSTVAQPAPPTQAGPSPIVIDVVVTDPNRNSVHYLKASDFILLESNHAQTISAFAEHPSWEAAEPLPVAPNLPTGAFSNLTIAPVHGALNILLLDLLNAPATAREDLRNRVVRYLQQVHPGTHLAIVGLTTRLILLQGFTTDPQQLSTVLSAKDDAPASTAAPNSSSADDESSSDTPLTSFGNNPSADQIKVGLRQFLSDVPSLPFQARAHTTLDALNQLARMLGKLPGRKNLIWLSGSFPINIQPDGEQPTPFAAAASSEPEYRQTASLFARSQVAVYPVDAASNTVAPAAGGPSPNAKYIRDPVSRTSNPANLYQLTAEEPGAMQAMAQATGGEAIALTGELKDAVEKAVDRGANYYSLTYTPTDRSGNGAYRTIQVNTSTPGLTLAYRHSYFAVDLSAAPPPVEPPPGSGKPAPYDPMRAAMMSAAPVPTQIVFVASVAPLSAGDTAADQAKSPFRRYSVQLGIDANDITCPVQPDGTHHCTLDISMAASDATGASLNLVSGGIQATIASDQYAPTLQTGLAFHQDISVPLASAIFLRIGIHDRATGKVGAIEMPLAGISTLPPVTAQPQGKNQLPAQDDTKPAEQH